MGPDGGLYSTNASSNAGGVVFKVRPSPTVQRSVLAPWMENTLHTFGLYDYDGLTPAGGVIFDQAGNIYGAATSGDGPFGPCPGVVYELSPSGSGWTENILYTFEDDNAAASLVGDLLFDSAGNLYGVASQGGTYGDGIIYELSPSNGGWTETVIHNFTNGSDGANPQAGLIADNSGHLYGTTSSGGLNGSGRVFVLTASGGQWALSTIANFYCCGAAGSYGPLVMDGAGNLYGTTNAAGAHDTGSVFELTPSDGGWVYTELYYFGSSGPTSPTGSLVVSGNGTLYGTAQAGGNQYCIDGCGAVWEITP